MRSRIVHTSNVRALAVGVEEVRNRVAGQSAILVLTGETGIGKTCAQTYVVLQNDGISVDVPPVATPYWLLCRIGRELGLSAKRSAAAMYDALDTELSARPRILAFDNWEPWPGFLTLFETLRILADRTNVAIVMTGMPAMLRELNRHAHLKRRISQVIEFQPIALDDARKIARELAELPISEDVIPLVYERSKGFTGAFCVELARLEMFARRNGLSAIDSRHVAMSQAKPQARPLVTGAVAA
jgi:DNA transposition AAA+ family ATPase